MSDTETRETRYVRWSKALLGRGTSGSGWVPIVHMAMDEADRETAAARAEVERLRGVVEAVRAALSDRITPSLGTADWAIDEAQYARVNPGWLRAIITEARDVRAALASVPSSGEAGERARRYDQCDGTCTTDCGHCKGQGRPASPEPTGAEAALTSDVVSAVLEAYHPDGVALWLAQWASGAGDRTRMVAGVLAEWSGEPAVAGTFDGPAPVLSGGQADGEGASADDDVLRFTDEEIEHAYAAMAEGEWQWFQWLLREKVRALAARPVLSREALILALGRADGQEWESLAATTSSAAEIMYGAQADAVLALLDGGRP